VIRISGRLGRRSAKGAPRGKMRAYVCVCVYMCVCVYVCVYICVLESYGYNAIVTVMVSAGNGYGVQEEGIPGSLGRRRGGVASNNMVFREINTVNREIQ
jgi:hypothetical protein